MSARALVVALSVCAMGAGEPRPDEREAGFADPALVFTKKPPLGLVGMQVHLDHIRVQGKSGNGLWVGPTKGRRIFVVPVDPSFIEFVAVGAVLDIRGVLRETPAPAQARKSWAVDARTARCLAYEPVYIDAWNLN
jgi:hypothetical protein